MSALKNIFMRAASHQPLTPQQRALRRLIIHGILYQALTALAAAFQGVIMLFATPGFQFNWSMVGGVALVAFLCSLLSGGERYATAHKDAPLGIGLGVLSSLAQQLFKNGLGGFLAMVKEPDKSNLALAMMQALVKTQVGGGTAPLPAIVAPPAPVMVASAPVAPPAVPSPAPASVGASQDYAG